MGTGPFCFLQPKCEPLGAKEYSPLQVQICSPDCPSTNLGILVPASRVGPEQRSWECLLCDHAGSTLLPYQTAVNFVQLLPFCPSWTPILHLQPKVSTRLEWPRALRYPTWVPGSPGQIPTSPFKHTPHLSTCRECSA